MVNYGSHPIRHNVNTLPKWARTYIMTGGIEGKIMSINSLPQWARDQIIEIRKYHAACKQAERDLREKECKSCKRKCSPKNRALCYDLRDIPPCG